MVRLDTKSQTISYTIGADSPVAALRGMAVTGGVPDTIKGTRVFRFAESFGGQRIAVRVDGRPELEAEWARIEAEKQAEKTEADRLWNLPANTERRRIRTMFDRAENLRDYPGDYHPAIARAEKALAAWRNQYPAEAQAEAEESDRRMAADKARRASEFANSFIGRGLD
jgi:hypothetical protein